MDRVLISNRSDISTNQVIDWFEYLNEDWVRFNGESFVDGSELGIRLSDSEFSYKMGEWNGGEEAKNKVWFRRFFPYDYYEKLKQGLPRNQADILTNVFGEINTAFNFLVNYESWDNKLRKRSVNKLESLRLARRNNIAIPDTLVTTSKKELLAFLEAKKRIIIKALSDSFSFNADDFSAAVYTKELVEKDLQDLPEHFFISLFQELLHKTYEIRSFYLNGKFYSMAIFSQSNEQTKVDFREYDDHLPNRNVPFQLPLDLEKKLTKLMEDLNLDTGSIDLVKTTDGKYVFLEVNPVGQFGMVSHPCNYRLEEKIVKDIIENTRR